MQVLKGEGSVRTDMRVKVGAREAASAPAPADSAHGRSVRAQHMAAVFVHSMRARFIFVHWITWARSSCQHAAPGQPENGVAAVLQL